ncbi:MAG TPA: beta-galactosidase [Candidatus Dormibacteraeota bacterium]|nr:beta-galactosidase [Candidatus Dormibacteraeota bacterium]
MSRLLRGAALGAGLIGLAALPVISEVRLRRPRRRLGDAWRRLPIESRGETRLGISFRTPQLEPLGLDAESTLRDLLRHPFARIRLGAYWNRIESAPDRFRFDELDAQIDACERAGKEIILCLGPLKTFGYPEFFVPRHHLPEPLEEGSLVRPQSHSDLLAAATRFLTRVVERYRERPAIIAWQLEHEAVDPLGNEHSWRMATDFVERELRAVRGADPGRPVLMNGFLPTSLPVHLHQWWRTRDQGDSLVAAEGLADIVGIDYYPRHALLDLGPLTLYLDGSRSPWQAWRRRRIQARVEKSGRRLMVSEAQAEPWEAVTTPPSPDGEAMYSCSPESLIDTYNRWMRWSGGRLSAYLFWGAEYWIHRQRAGDGSYLGAFDRVLEES